MQCGARSLRSSQFWRAHSYHHECRCAERLKDVRSDEEDHEEDVVTEAVGAGGTQLSKGDIFCSCGKA